MYLLIISSHESLATQLRWEGKNRRSVNWPFWKKTIQLHQYVQTKTSQVCFGNPNRSGETESQWMNTSRIAVHIRCSVDHPNLNEITFLSFYSLPLTSLIEETWDILFCFYTFSLSHRLPLTEKHGTQPVSGLLWQITCSWRCQIKRK
jgi:hypothetical protein